MALIDLETVLSLRPLGLVFDIDGTISPIAAAPDAAYLYPGIGPLLEQARERAHVAIMTGRGIEDGAAKINIDGLTYIGTHGLEWSDGLPTLHPVQLLPEAMKYVEPGKQLLDLVKQHEAELPGVIVQYKTVGGSIHYRSVSDPQQTRKELFALLEEPARHLNMRLREGKKVVEVLAPLEVNKGQALRRFVEYHALQGVIFAGDDRTDLDAVMEMDHLQEKGVTALAVVVQYRDTPIELLDNADIIVDGVEGMAKLLGEIVGRL